jgi:hypothetical protein
MSTRSQWITGTSNSTALASSSWCPGHGPLIHTLLSFQLFPSRLEMHPASSPPYLPHYMSQAQQREEAAAKEAIRQANLVTPTPSPHPVTPVELETIQSESDKCRIYWKHLTMILETFLSQTTTTLLWKLTRGMLKNLFGLGLPLPSLSELPALLGVFLNTTITPWSSGSILPHQQNPSVMSNISLTMSSLMKTSVLKT